MYEDIFDKLSTAKNAGNKEQAKESLYFLVNKIRSTLAGPMDQNTFADFIQDKNLIFKTNEDDFSGDIEVKISTDGLLSQILDISGATDHEKISNKLKDSIFDLHSNLSRGVTNNKEKIDRIQSTLDLIVLAIS